MHVAFPNRWTRRDGYDSRPALSPIPQPKSVLWRKCVSFFVADNLFVLEQPSFLYLTIIPHSHKERSPAIFAIESEMTRRPGDKTPEPPGGRAAERLRMFEEARRPKDVSRGRKKRKSAKDAKKDGPKKKG
jgi:hypothetical protein